MATRQEELLPILKALKEYIVKEYAVNYPPHVRGEDASAKELPADWQGKLDPITGGDTVGRDTFGSAGQNTTKAGSQAEDAYIHKSELEQILKDFVSKHFVNGQTVQQSGSRGENAGYTYPGEAARIPEGLEKNEHEDEEEATAPPPAFEAEAEAAVPEMEEEEAVDVEEDEEEDMEAVAAQRMMYSRDDSNVAAILKDIKGLLSSRQAEKREFASLKGELSEIKKSLPSQVKQGIAQGMKRFNITPSASDQPIRREVTTAPVAAKELAPDQRIGVEGESFAKDVDWQRQDEFTHSVEQILDSNDAGDLKGTFKKLNGMRTQSGELTPQTLYYYPRGGAK
jgi:hypothetical protein